ncbi:hypothetical protein ABZ547_21955 [Streptomyces sparsogenes]|uniref:hypothetical protein n=1 Tax=Streptomyces sparsogenes TaxID=67365 RepID=UPI0033FF4D61
MLIVIGGLPGTAKTTLALPNWQQVVDREYEPWDRERVVVDTAGQSPRQPLALLLRGLASG